MHESLSEFYSTRKITEAHETVQVAYNVFRLEQHGFSSERPATYCRRDFYKIALIRGENRCHYAQKSIVISGSTLMFFNPHTPYTWEPLSDETGYFCIFKEAFYSEGLRRDVKQLPMFAPAGKPAYKLDRNCDDRISSIFEKMLGEKTRGSSYYFDLARTYINEIIFFALGLEPTEVLYLQSNAKSRLTSVFFELLDRQFNFYGQQQENLLRSASHYAERLNVHVNHLNSAVKATTGKTTTEHILERVSAEAQCLLKTTKLNVSEIAYQLGFKEQGHFFNFFKKIHGLSPSEFRRKNANDAVIRANG